MTKYVFEINLESTYLAFPSSFVQNIKETFVKHSIFRGGICRIAKTLQRPKNCPTVITGSSSSGRNPTGAHC